MLLQSSLDENHQLQMTIRENALIATEFRMLAENDDKPKPLDIDDLNSVRKSLSTTANKVPYVPLELSNLEDDYDDFTLMANECPRPALSQAGAPERESHPKLLRGSIDHLAEPVNFPLSILAKWRFEGFPVHKVVAFLENEYVDPEVSTRVYNFRKKSTEVQYVLHGVYAGPVLLSCTPNAIAKFQAQQVMYREQGGKEELFKAIVGTAATALKGKCPRNADIEEADLWNVLYEFHGPKHRASLMSLFKFIAEEMYSLHMLASMDADSATTALQGYAMTIFLVVTNIPVTLQHQITRQDMVDRFLDRISVKVCGNAKNCMLDYILSYTAATVYDDRNLSRLDF